MAYPSIITTFTNPNSTDKLSTTPHSSIETAQNTGLTELMTFVGTLSSNVGTLVYDIRSANSDGGGHVQVANKGGTGQTSYTKGDILVASSSSVLSKLAAGNDNQVLMYDSSVASGIKAGDVATGAQIQNMAFSYIQDGGTGSVYQIYPSPCVLSYAAGQLFTFKTANANTVASPALSISSLVAKTIQNPDGTAVQIGQIPASTITMVQFEGTSSVFQLLSRTKMTTYIGSATGTTSITVDSAATMCVVKGVYGDGSRTAVGEVTLFKTGKTTGVLQSTETNGVDNLGASYSWSGTTISISANAGATLGTSTAYQYSLY